VALDLTAPETYASYVRVDVVDATPDRAVVTQPPDPEVDNHVKVRHASALWTAGHEAARQLVLAALGERAESAGLTVTASEIAYKQVGLGVLTSTAQPRGGAWQSLQADLGAGREAEVEVAVSTTDPEGKEVVTLDLRWAVKPAA